eukprot:TRINITY_DN62967_c0_g1_i1.p1 TRINITY_DN62967_c0_g1~~TRINITY_DN62967_c0_g1_i1.p1  ORF type:complete len:239 (+),score=39.48 TRINITY_DN62967_c0_g1_i1:109-825(+)
MGWGWADDSQAHNKMRPMMISDPSRTVWVGDLPDGADYTDLLAVARRVGNAKWAEVLKGTGAVGFATPEEAAAAVSSLDGATVGNRTISCDMWSRKQGSSNSWGNSWNRSGDEKKSWGANSKGWKPQSDKGWDNKVWKPQFQKKWHNTNSGGKHWDNKSDVSAPSKTVWVGNLPEGTKYQELVDLGKTVGNARWAQVFGKTGAICFSSDSEATGAVAALTGASVGGQMISVDSWQRKS